MVYLIFTTGRKTQKTDWHIGPCTNRPIVFPLQIGKKWNNDSLSVSLFFNLKNKSGITTCYPISKFSLGKIEMDYWVVFRLSIVR